MPFTRSRAAIVIAMFACEPASARAEQLTIRYGMTMLGLPLGTAGVTATFEPTSYRIAIDAKLSGLASLVASFKTAANASGALSEGRVNPAAFATTSSSAAMTRTVRMSLASGAVRAMDISPPLEDLPGRVPVSEADKRSVVDPVSALAMHIPGAEPLMGPAACNRTIAVFDGYTRFDLALRYTGLRGVKVKGYAGPVTVCNVRYQPVSGHRPDRPGTKFLAASREIEVWLAPVERMRLVVPFRISLPTLVGTAVIEAAEWRDEAAAASRTP